MTEFIVEGGCKLSGEVRVSGSKNSSMPVLIASILLNQASLAGNITLANVPFCDDVCTVIKILREIGVSFNIEYQNGESLLHFTQGSGGRIVPNIYNINFASLIRTSIIFMGPLLAVCGEAKIPMPGGCRIGERKIDIHLEMAEKMGAELFYGDDFIELKAPNGLNAINTTLRFASVGASHNIIMMCCLANGTSTIQNISIEPEVVCLVEFLQFCGANIALNKSTQTITIVGTEGKQLSSKPSADKTFTIYSDRIEAGTFVIASAITNSPITLTNCPINLFDSMLSTFANIGIALTKLSETSVFVKLIDGSINACNVKTDIFPAFPTDMQAQVASLLCLANKGNVSTIVENIFESRFSHVMELAKIGANVAVENNTCIIKPVQQFNNQAGIALQGNDLRACAGLIIATMMRGRGVKTIVKNIIQLDRGYEFFEKKLNKLGANIKRVH